MDERQLRELVAETGRILLEKELVARTWGNISARCDENRYVISPSGLGYEGMTGEDVPVCNLNDDTWEGNRKPSSEGKVHAAAYRVYPDVNFVIHTHQDYATAIGLAGISGLKLSSEEEEVLGRIEVAEYGLPGTKKLSDNVKAAMKKGSKVILMKHHGVLIVGADRDDTIRKAQLLEQVCKRAVIEKLGRNDDRKPLDAIDQKLLNASVNMEVFSTPDILYMADLGGFVTQIDDMAQMLGNRIKAVENDNDLILRELNKRDAVLVKNAGCVIMTERSDDTAALKLLIKKAAMAKRYTLACGVDAQLSVSDCKVMRTNYVENYSIQKDG
ncbi:MAG: class II aldolase/adducin family protein [Lachnospiraceae bacterium]|nr:class II aldolase/adducin family protein [Lachnospiraceae bacterium]